MGPCEGSRGGTPHPSHTYVGVAELVDALVLGTSAFMAEVQVLLPTLGT